MILEQKDVFKKIFRKILPIFDGVGIFKGSKSHDSRSFQMKTWYQNVRKLLNYKLSIVRALRSISLDFDSYFSDKNLEISATQWSKNFWNFFFLDSKICSKLSRMIFYPIVGAYPSSAFGTAIPTHRRWAIVCKWEVRHLKCQVTHWVKILGNFSSF